MTVVVYGPMACGKTRNAEALAAHFGLGIIVDDWDPSMHRLTHGALHLSHYPFEGPAARSINFSDVKFDPEARIPRPIYSRPRPNRYSTPDVILGPAAAGTIAHYSGGPTGHPKIAHLSVADLRKRKGPTR